MNKTSHLIEFINAMEVREMDRQGSKPRRPDAELPKPEKPNPTSCQYKNISWPPENSQVDFVLRRSPCRVFGLPRCCVRSPAYDELELDTGRPVKPTVPYPVHIMVDDSFDALISMCYTQLFNLLRKPTMCRRQTAGSCALFD